MVTRILFGLITLIWNAEISEFEFRADLCVIFWEPGCDGVRFVRISEELDDIVFCEEPIQCFCFCDIFAIKKHVIVIILSLMLLQHYIPPWTDGLMPLGD